MVELFEHLNAIVKTVVGCLVFLKDVLGFKEITGQVAILYDMAVDQCVNVCAMLLMNVHEVVYCMVA